MKMVVMELCHETIALLLCILCSQFHVVACLLDDDSTILLLRVFIDREGSDIDTSFTLNDTLRLIFSCNAM